MHAVEFGGVIKRQITGLKGAAPAKGYKVDGADVLFCTCNQKHLNKRV